MYGMLFTNIMSTAAVTSFYLNCKSGDMFDLFRLTELGFFQVVVPFRAPISGPKNDFGSQNVILVNWAI